MNAWHKLTSLYSTHIQIPCGGTLAVFREFTSVQIKETVSRDVSMTKLKISFFHYSEGVYTLNEKIRAELVNKRFLRWQVWAGTSTWKIRISQFLFHFPVLLHKYCQCAHFVDFWNFCRRDIAHWKQLKIRKNWITSNFSLMSALIETSRISHLSHFQSRR